MPVRAPPKAAIVPMCRTLAIETSGLAGSVALADGDRLLVVRRLPEGSRSARTLAPTMRAALADAGWQPADVELVGVSVGPGSFTGLRIGVTTAKTFAYAVGALVVGCDTLEVIARGMPPAERMVVALDAGRGELYSAEFGAPMRGEPADELAGLKRLRNSHIVGIDEWLGRLAPGVMVGGEALNRLADRLPAGVLAADRDAWTPAAAEVARLAIERKRAGTLDDVWKLKPVYLRLSAAEEKSRQQRAID